MDSVKLYKKYNNKCVDKILVRPPLCNITMKELISALDCLGFKLENITGSHYKFSHPICPEVPGLVIPKPHGGKNEVKRAYIKEIQERIEEINERKGNIL